MDSLPGELRVEICSHLPHRDLLSLSRTCGSYAAAAKPFLFETLTFHGDEEASRHHVLLKHPRDRDRVGPFKPVELASLRATIGEVIKLDIPKYSTALQYSPRVYDEDFWERYEEWVDEQMQESEDRVHELDPEGAHGSISDSWNLNDEPGLREARAELQRRQSRSNREYEIVERARMYWNSKMSDEWENKAANLAALVRLFKSMPKLDRLQIMEWSCARELQRFGINDDIDLEVESQFAMFDIFNAHLEMLSRALVEAGIRIKHLLLPTVLAPSITIDPAVQKLFTGLSSLSLHYHDPYEMLVSAEERPVPFRTLIHCARHTLERLEFSNMFVYDASRPNHGEHLLAGSWGYEPGRETSPLIFPKLRILELTCLILYTPSLVGFLREQPSLEKVAFKHIYLPTRGYGWPDVAAALPLSCHSLHLHDCGGLSTPKIGPDPPPDSEIECKDIEPFDPHHNPFPESCGWQLSTLYIERETEKHIAEHYVPRKLHIAEQLVSAQGHTERQTSASLDELHQKMEELEREIAWKREAIKEKFKEENEAEYERI